MEKRNIHFQVDNGLKARHIAMMVQEASKYESSIYIQFGEKKVNAKSIMGMMTLGLHEGKEVMIWAEGEDEEEAAQKVAIYLKRTSEDENK